MTTLATSEALGMEQLPEWAQQRRQSSRQRFERLGLPTLRDEPWRFTNIDAIRNIDWTKPEDESTGSFTLDQFEIPGLDAARAVFVDGRFSEQFSDLSGLGEGVQCTLLHESMDHASVEQRLGTLSSRHEDGFTALNDAQFDHGLFIEVQEGAAANRPVHVLSIATRQPAPVATHPRVLIIAGRGARIQVIEHYNTTQPGIVNLSNAVTEIFAAEHAFVEHYLLERESEQAFNISTLFIEQQTRSRVHSHTVLLGGSIVRNNVVPRLEGERAHCMINGLYVGHEEQHLDNQMRVYHSAPNCESRQYYKGIMMDRSRGVFTGRIVVDKAGQGTDAIQTNRNMLLSDDARVNARPQLEIFADDVRCTHGATTGRVDDEAVFYFMSRGLSEEVARAMLVYAFAAEGFDRMDLAPVRRLLAAEMIAKLPKAQGLSIEV